MSRSYRHSPVCSMTKTDDQDWWFKRYAHHCFRRRTRDALRTGRLDKLPYSYREVMDVWDWPKDGRTHMWTPWIARWSRRTLAEWLEMRKRMMRK